MSGDHHSPNVMDFYLNLSSDDMTNTSSHICGSWYLPIFPFRDGSLTLISIASLMVLAILWTSLSTMLKFSRDSPFEHSYNPRKNITKEEAQALADLREDHSRVILTADNGVAIMVMDRTEYSNKAQNLLEDGGTFKEIKTDPTNKLKSKLINLFMKTKAEGDITDHIYKKMYPTVAVAPKFYGLPKIHKRVRQSP